ncbi:MAG: hypothetical protein HRU41_20475 [Saprospiraceae bacterium]|nr:hypothetical protein [Saprospiraceae bacterium]
MPKKLFLLLIAVLLSLPAFNQTKKGFKFLKKKQTEKAWKAFAADTSKAETAMAAYYGLAKVCELYARKSLARASSKRVCGSIKG